MQQKEYNFKIKTQMDFCRKVRLKFFLTIEKTYDWLFIKNRKLSNLLELREKLHKVDKLKLEKTINSLKDRINTLTNQKSQQYPCK